MDIEIIERSVRDLVAFKNRIETAINGADDNVAKASDDLDSLLAFKRQVEAVLPDFLRAASEVQVLTGEISGVMSDLAGIKAWVEEQKADAAAKPVPEPAPETVVEVEPAPQIDQAPAETTDKPLAHLAEVEQALPDPAPEAPVEAEHTEG